MDWSDVTQGRRPAGKPGRKGATRIERRQAAIDRRRELTRRRARQEAQRRRRKRAAVSALAVLIIAVAGIGTFVVVNRGSGKSTPNYTLTSPIVASPTTDLSISNAPATYHLTYKVDTTGAEGVSTSTEDVTVQRPFNGIVVAKGGVPPGGTEQWRAVSNFGLYSDTTAGGQPTVQHSVPQAALGDFRLDATLQDLVTAGTFAPREVRQVLGRECQVYRTGEPLESFGTQAATSTDYTDACIDNAGLMLEEVSVQSGALAERIIATAVDTPATIANDTFAIAGTPASVADGGVDLTQVDPSAPPAAGYWVLDTPPPGYTLMGRYHLVMQAQDTSSTDPEATTTTTEAGQAPPTTESWADVYVNGNNLIEINQGSGQEPDTQTTGGVTGDLGALGSTTAIANLTGSELVAHPGQTGNYYVHVMGTVPLATIQQVASSLHK
jgi:hypothetical protein